MQRSRMRAATAAAENGKENRPPLRAVDANAMPKMPALEIANDTSSEDESDGNDEQKLFRILYKLKNAKKDQAKKQRAKQCSELQSTAQTEFARAAKLEVQKVKKQRTASRNQLDAEFRNLVDAHSAAENLVTDLNTMLHSSEYTALTTQTEVALTELSALSGELASMGNSADHCMHDLVQQATQAVEDKIGQLETRLRQIEKTRSNDRFTKLFETILLNF